MPEVCAAAAVNLYLFPNGEVRACCMNSLPYGVIGESGLLEIWEGAQRRDLVERLAVGDLSRGCGGCEAAIRLEGRERAYPATFDRIAEQTVDPRWPVRMEFNLSNACNLQCVQCNGELSSSIRLHRENRPAAVNPYDDRFFDDLRSFIPHLRWAQFAGGEPFLAPETYRVWDLVEELNPDLQCVVVTNATRWSERVESVARRLRMGFNFSLDGITRETYESIRVGASFDEVLRNIERFRSIAVGSGSPVEVNFCLMRQNFHELADVLIYAEERSMPVNVMVVRDPPSCSLATLPRSELAVVHNHLLADHERARVSLDLNRSAWTDELARIEGWLDAPPDDLAVATTTWVTLKPTLPPMIQGFPLVAGGVHDDAGVRARLGSTATSGTLHWFASDVHDTVVEVSSSIHELLGVPGDELLDGPASGVQVRALQRFGEMRSFDVIAADEHEMTAVAAFDGVTVDLCMVAMRDDRGRASAVKTFLVVRATAAEPSGTATVLPGDVLK